MKVITGKVKHIVIPVLVNPLHSTVAYSLSDKASLLNECFAQQTVLEEASSAVLAKVAMNNDKFSSISMTPKEVFAVLSRLKEKKAAGADDLPPRLLKYCAQGIAALQTFSTKALLKDAFLLTGRRHSSSPYTKKVPKQTPGIIGPLHSSPSSAR